MAVSKSKEQLKSITAWQGLLRLSSLEHLFNCWISSMLKMLYVKQKYLSQGKEKHFMVPHLFLQMHTYSGKDIPCQFKWKLTKCYISLKLTHSVVKIYCKAAGFYSYFLRRTYGLWQSLLNIFWSVSGKLCCSTLPEFYHWISVWTYWSPVVFH